MAEIRLSKIIKQYNIGLGTLVDFLNTLGAGIEDANPNMKVSDEYMGKIQNKFGADLKHKEEADKVDVKMTEILDKASRRQREEAEEDDFEPVRETIIKNNNLSRTVPVQNEPAPAPKPEPTPKPEPEPEPVPEPAPVPAPAPEPAPAPAPAPEKPSLPLPPLRNRSPVPNPSLPGKRSLSPRPSRRPFPSRKPPRPLRQSLNSRPKLPPSLLPEPAN